MNAYLQPKKMLPGVVVALGLLLTALSTARGQSMSGASVVGERDDTGQFYEWTVTNTGDQPIVGIELPHFRVDLWTAPDGWSTDKSTNIQGMPGVREESGFLRAEATSPTAAIMPGASKTFKARINRKGAPRGHGKVTLTRADDTKLIVQNVVMPAQETWLDQYIMPIGLGVLLLIIVASQAMKKRKPTAAGDEPAEA